MHVYEQLASYLPEAQRKPIKIGRKQPQAAADNLAAKPASKPAKERA